VQNTLKNEFTLVVLFAFIVGSWLNENDEKTKKGDLYH